jgi:pilus assembly protein CpaE
MTLLYEPAPGDAHQLGVILGGSATTVTTLDDLTALLTADGDELLVVLGAATDRGEALRFAVRQRISRPALGVILLRNEVDTQMLSDALRAGVREVVVASDVAAVRDACARSLEVSRQLRRAALSAAGGHVSGAATADAQVITVFAAKGGCGKTTVATNLAIALSNGGKQRVCLIDLDLAFGDVAIMLQLRPERTIADAVSMADRLDETGLRALMTPFCPGVDTLLAPSGPTEGEHITRSLVSEVLRQCCRMFDYVVVDTPPQFTDQVLAALDASHYYVLVTAPDILTLKNLRVTLDMFDLLGYADERRLVALNRADARVGLTAGDIQKVIRVPVAANIPSSRDVPIAINRGIPIMVDHGSHPVSKAIRELADRTRPAQQAAANPKQPAQHSAGRRRLFSGRKGK